jgi:hypothetical protein
LARELQLANLQASRGGAHHRSARDRLIPRGSSDSSASENQADHDGGQECDQRKTTGTSHQLSLLEHPR